MSLLIGLRSDIIYLSLFQFGYEVHASIKDSLTFYSMFIKGCLKSSHI